MNSPKLLIVGALILAGVAFAGGYAFHDRRAVDNSPSPTPSPTATASASATPSAKAPVGYSVRLTASGPVPKTLTISAGDQVTFTSEVQSGYWVASQPHPAHDMCPGFDARRGLASGDTYALSFPTAGTCDYYNHLDPYNSVYTGSIVIR